MPSILTLDALLLTGLFGAVGLLHLAGPRSLKLAYRRWGFSFNAHRVIGTLEVLTALFLSNPVTVALVNHGRYVYSLPGLLLMAALVPATLAGPL